MMDLLNAKITIKMMKDDGFNSNVVFVCTASLKEMSAHLHCLNNNIQVM